MQIKHRITGAVLFECEAEGLRQHVSEALTRIDGAFDVDANGCWLWRYGLTHCGHARISIANKDYFVHRLTCEMAHGLIPDGLFACHSCGVGHCINPAHLYIGTAADNARDAMRHGRTGKGKRHTPERRAKIAAGVRRALADIREQAALQQ